MPVLSCLHYNRLSTTAAALKGNLQLGGLAADLVSVGIGLEAAPVPWAHIQTAIDWPGNASRLG